MDDLYYNAGGGTIYLRFQGHYYVRRIGQNWNRTAERQIPESEAPNPETWDKLHEIQRNLYVKQLINDKLIEE